MLHVIATDFQKVEPLIFNVPSGSGTVGQLLDIVFVDIQKSGKTISIGKILVPVANGSYRKPVHLKLLFIIPDRHDWCTLVDSGLAFFQAFDVPNVCN